eukprot:14762884-Alexandrium_andersonii.AAC.1
MPGCRARSAAVLWGAVRARRPAVGVSLLSATDVLGLAMRCGGAAASAPACKHASTCSPLCV